MKSLLAVLAASIPAVAWTASSSLDEQFFYDAAESGVAEVSDANLAKKRAADHAVQSYADQILKDQTAANDKLQSLAVSESVDIPGHPGLKQRAEHAKLDLVDTTKFSREYVQGEDKTLRNAIMLYEQEVSSGKDPMARSYAQDMLPMLKSRLEEIRRIAARIGANIS
jgi:putative membrane protein